LKGSSIFISYKRYNASIVLIHIELMLPKPCVSHHPCLWFFMSFPRSIHTNNMKFLPVAMLYLAGNFGKTQAAAEKKNCTADPSYFDCDYVDSNIKVVACTALLEDANPELTTWQVTLDVAAIKGCDLTQSISWVCCRDDDNCAGFGHKVDEVASTATFNVTGNLPANGLTTFHVHDGKIAGELNGVAEWENNGDNQTTCGGWGNGCLNGGLCEIELDLGPCCGGVSEGCAVAECTSGCTQTDDLSADYCCNPDDTEACDHDDACVGYPEDLVELCCFPADQPPTGACCNETDDYDCPACIPTEELPADYCCNPGDTDACDPDGACGGYPGDLVARCCVPDVPTGQCCDQIGVYTCPPPPPEWTCTTICELVDTHPVLPCVADPSVINVRRSLNDAAAATAKGAAAATAEDAALPDNSHKFIRRA
jgi:hypothetical protein